MGIPLNLKFSEFSTRTKCFPPSPAWTSTGWNIVLMHTWHMMELAWSFMATKFATRDGSPTQAKVLWIQEICTQLWHNYEIIAGKKITRNIIWDMTLTICYICFNKKQVQQLIHNNKTTMSSLYLLFVLFVWMFICKQHMFSHITHTSTNLYLDIPLTFSPAQKAVFPVRWFRKSLEPPHPWSSESAPHILWSFGP